MKQLKVPFPRKGCFSRQDVPTVLVTDANRGSAIAIIRSLGRQGWRVIAADADPRSLGFYSRYTRARVIYPTPATAPGEMAAALRRAACEHRIDLIIPVTDEIILPLAGIRDQFEGVCEVALPDTAALQVVTDKCLTVALAEQVGVPTPRTYQVHTIREAQAKAPRLRWPVVLKPQTSRLYRDRTAIESFAVCYAETPARLAEQMRRFEGRCPVLLQEYYAGVGHGVELLTFQGRPLAAFQHRRLREVPVYGGVSAFRESVPLDFQLYSYAARLLQALNWTGLAMIEFKLGDDGPKLMEINGRVWGSLPLAVHSGMDFPARAAALRLYGPPAGLTGPTLAYRPGVRSHNLGLELLWIATVLAGKRRYPFLPMPGRIQAITALLSLLNPANKFDILSLTDPLPGLLELPKTAAKLARKLKAELQDNGDG